jgi:Ala-tRNA(Pro) deacylase
MKSRNLLAKRPVIIGRARQNRNRRKGFKSAFDYPGAKPKLLSGPNSEPGKDKPMPAKKLKEYLDKEKIKYVSIIHSTAYTAQEVAASTHITGRELAKTVIVQLDGKMAMAVLPANRKIVLQDLREVTGSDEVKFASEEDFKEKFPECETGAMPPFGNLYGMDVYLAEALTSNDHIAFNAGSHTEVIKMRLDDFERLVKPRVVSFTN